MEKHKKTAALLAAACAISLCLCSCGAIRQKRNSIKIVNWNAQTFFDANKDGIEYPNFMERVVDYYKGGRNLRVDYRDVCMTARTVDDDYDMTVREKYEALSASAVTKVLLDRAFTTAGNCGKNRLFFEKDIMLKPRTWIYLRVEFPSELTWAVDPLLHYVKDYQP